LIGDTAQLPPVHQSVSPALDAQYLQQNFRLHVQEMILTEVMRQQEKSGILENATHLRNLIENQDLNIKFNTKSYKDIYRMTHDKLEDGLRYAYKKVGVEQTIVICRSNKIATQYNQYIRNQIRFSESEIEAGDLLLIVKNNYTWLPNDSSASFLANGEFVEVMKIIRIETQYNLRFADVLLKLVDYPEHPYFEAKIHLSTLYSYEPNLSEKEYKKLYEDVKLDYQDEPSKYVQSNKLKKDPYLNALQVKFAYALTCHKAQGGQWKIVFVEQGYLKEEMINVEFLRWIYTAITRAMQELYLVSFDTKFYEQIE
jgi:ATP-dependent exoDNAse (exonuclease V) alpha subunit